MYTWQISLFSWAWRDWNKNGMPGTTFLLDDFSTCLVIGAVSVYISPLLCTCLNISVLSSSKNKLHCSLQCLPNCGVKWAKVVMFPLYQSSHSVNFCLFGRKKKTTQLTDGKQGISLGSLLAFSWEQYKACHDQLGILIHYTKCFVFPSFTRTTDTGSCPISKLPTASAHTHQPKGPEPLTQPIIFQGPALVFFLLV